MERTTKTFIGGFVIGATIFFIAGYAYMGHKVMRDIDTINHEQCASYMNVMRDYSEGDSAIKWSDEKKAKLNFITFCNDYE